MILEQAERDRVQQLLCETLPAICQASLSGFADIKVDALIGITLNKSDVFLVSIKETCHPDGAVDIDEGKGGRPSKVNKIIAKTEVSTKRTSGRGRRKKAKRAASESEEEYIPSKKASQRGENDELDTSTTAAEQSEGSPRKRSRAQRKSAVKAEASFQEQEPDDDEAPELPPHGTAEFSDDDFVGDDTGDYSDMDNDDETEMTDIRQQIDNQQASLDKMMIKQEPDSTDRTSTADGDDDFLDRPFTASKASDDQMENTDEQDTSSNKQVIPKLERDDGKESRTESTDMEARRCNEKQLRDKTGKFVCNICGFTTKFSGNMTRHKFTHNEKTVACDLCPAKFRSVLRMKTHRNGHTSGFVCDVCARPYKTFAGLYVHKRTTHLKDGNFKCAVCDRNFISKKQHSRHMQSHLGIKEHSCQFCGKAFVYFESRKRHEPICQRKKNKIKPKSYDCTICGKKMSTKDYLREHMDGAHGNVIYTCTCGKTFRWRGSLHNHRRTCSLLKGGSTSIDTEGDEEKPYKCFCGKAFNTASKLYSHKKKCACGTSYVAEAEIVYPKPRDESKKDV